MEIKVTRPGPGEPVNERYAREYLRAYELISTAVHDHLVDLDALTIANALCSVAANVLSEAGMSQADVANLLETLASLTRKAEVAGPRSDA
jgi:hypothetical protein